MDGRRSFGWVVTLVAGLTACGKSESPSGDDGGKGQGARGGGAGTETGGKSGSGGSPSNGGSAPSGGTAPSGGSGDGGAGDGGGAGIGGTAGDGGAGGSGGVTTDPDVIARAAVVIGSCYPDDGVSRNGAHLWNWRESASPWRRFRLQAECIAEAGGGCRALDDCLGWTLAESPDCTPGPTCQAGVFSNCLERPGYENIQQTLDCATIGLACDTRVGCAPAPIDDCDPNTYVANCSSAGVPQSCPPAGVVSRGPDCEELGLTCYAASPGGTDPVVPLCVGTGDECTLHSDALFTGIACAGATLEACVNGRREELDCGALGEGFSCQSVGGIPFCGLAADCLPAQLNGDGDRDVSQQGDPEPACDGTSIVFCNAGRLEHIDCTELGFTGCDLEAGLGCVPSPRTDLTP